MFHSSRTNHETSPRLVTSLLSQWGTPRAGSNPAPGATSHAHINQCSLILNHSIIIIQQSTYNPISHTTLVNHPRPRLVLFIKIVSFGLELLQRAYTHFVELGITLIYDVNGCSSRMWGSVSKNFENSSIQSLRINIVELSLYEVIA